MSREPESKIRQEREINLMATILRLQTSGSMGLDLGSIGFRNLGSAQLGDSCLGALCKSALVFQASFCITKEERKKQSSGLTSLRLRRERGSE